MEDPLPLLDTPKKRSLQSQSTLLRTALKDFERNFALEKGRKPSKDDIKADIAIASKYKEYNRIRDVLAGRLSLAALNTQESPKRKRHDGIDYTSSFTPRKRIREAVSRPDEIDQYDPPVSISPRAVYLNAIAPTPHRDGKVLGLLDMLSTPGSATTIKLTPRKVNREREADLYETSLWKLGKSQIAQTPSRRKAQESGDILEHLSGTPPQTVEATHRKHSRTPASDGKKFLLSQFFATPNAIRFSTLENDEKFSAKRTPLRDSILGTRSEDKTKNPTGDATPGYLKRSVSFKDRLLSASQRDNLIVGRSERFQHGPPTLRHFKSATNIVKLHSKPTTADQDDHEDDMDALRELESDELNTIAEDGRRQDEKHIDINGMTMRLYKKKGQKRTTRRAVMRPTITRAHEGPRFVADDEDDDSNDYTHTLTRKTQTEQNSDTIQTEIDVWVESDINDDTGTESENNQTLGVRKVIKKPKTDSSKVKADRMTKHEGHVRKAGMINPNAQSHMNFRSLKIKNKNSKAKGAGRGRFGKGRR